MATSSSAVFWEKFKESTEDQRFFLFPHDEKQEKFAVFRYTGELVSTSMTIDEFKKFAFKLKEIDRN